MSYRTIDRLTNDSDFQGRIRACTVEQAQHFQNDQRPAFVSLSADLLRGDSAPLLTFIRLSAAAPGVAAKAESAGLVDQTRVEDADILSIVQVAYPSVAALFYDEDGSLLLATKGQSND